MSSPHQILGLNETATKEQVKSRFKKLVMHCHPDRGGNEKEFKEIKDAKDTIINGDIKPDNKYTDALSIIGNFFQSMFGESQKPLESFDIVQCAIDSFNASIVKQKIKIVCGKSELKKYKKLQGRMKTNKHPNVFEQIITDNIDGCERVIKETNKHLDTLIRALEILNDYEYSYERQHTEALVGFIDSGNMSVSTTYVDWS